MPLTIRFPLDPSTGLQRIAHLLAQKQRATAAGQALSLAGTLEEGKLRELVELLADHLFAMGDARKRGRPSHTKAMLVNPDTWALAAIEDRARSEIEAAIVAYRLRREAKQARGRKLTRDDLQPLLWALGNPDVPPEIDVGELRAALLPHAAEYLDGLGLLGIVGRDFPSIAREHIAARYNAILKSTGIRALSPEKLALRTSKLNR